VTVDQGDLINVSATIDNTGDAEGTQDVEFRVDDDTLASEEVSLDAGDNTSVEFTNIDTSALEPGDYTHGVYTDDDSQTATLTIAGEDPADVPEDFPGTDAQFGAIDANNDGELSPIEIAQAITENGEQGNVGGVEFSPIEFAEIITWNANQ